MSAPVPQRNWLTKEQAVQVIRTMRVRAYPHIEIKHLADGRVSAIFGERKPKAKGRKS